MKTRAFLFTALLATGLIFTACSKEETTPSTDMTDSAAVPAPAPASPSVDTSAAPAPAPSSTDTSAAGATGTDTTNKSMDTTHK